MKIKRLLFAFLGIYILLFCFLSQKNTLQAADFSVCGGVTGCRKCAPNTSDPDVCQLEDQGVSPGVMCAAGAIAPSGSSCSAISGNPGACSATYIPCIANTVPNGGYYCSTSGTFPLCAQCDNDNNTAIPPCPGGQAAPFSNESLCHANCDQASNSDTCVTSGGVCKTSCPSGESSIPSTCTVGICCRANTPLDERKTSVNVRGACQENSIDTALGCIPIGDLGQFASFFLKWGLGISGGIAILMLIYSSFLIMTSGGDPKRLQTGRELLFSVVSGIILLVFSMFILRVLGVNVLGLI